MTKRPIWEVWFLQSKKDRFIFFNFHTLFKLLSHFCSFFGCHLTFVSQRKFKKNIYDDGFSNSNHREYFPKWLCTNLPSFSAAFYTPFFKEVWDKKPEIEQAFNMEDPSGLDDSGGDFRAAFPSLPPQHYLAAPSPQHASQITVSWRVSSPPLPLIIYLSLCASLPDYIQLHATSHTLLRHIISIAINFLTDAPIL